MENSGVSQDVGEDSSDPSLSDSWTVLDSCLLNEDGDLSDAESVEVLANETSDLIEGSPDHNSPSLEDTFLNVAHKIDSHSAGADVCFDQTNSCRENFISSAEMSDSGQNDTVPIENTCESPAQPVEPSSAESEDKKALFYYVLDISILLVTLNLILILVLVFTSKAPFIFGRYGYSGSSDSVTSRNLVGDECLLADPLSLQLSHVLSKWKKNLDEEHIMAHQVLKTVLSFFAEDNELESELHNLGKKVKQYDEVIAHTARYLGADSKSYQRMVMLGHLAHSAFDILDVKHRRDYFPLHIFCGLNVSAVDSGSFEPEPGPWLKNWHSSTTTLELNEASSTNIQTRKASSLVKDMYLHLGSAQWNSYFWEMYLKDTETGKTSPTEPIEKSVDMNNVASSDAEVSAVLNSSNPGPFDTQSVKKESTKLPSPGKFEEALEAIRDADPEYRRRRYKKQEIVSSFVQGQQGTKLAESTGDEIKNDNVKGKNSAKTKKLKYKIQPDNIDGKDFSKKKKKKKRQLNKDIDLQKRSSVYGERPAKNKESIFKEDIDESLSRLLEDKDEVPSIQSSKLKKAGKGQTRISEDGSDWNTRMARGRAKLRALNVAEEDLIWIFRRAKARRKLREFHPL